MRINMPASLPMGGEDESLMRIDRRTGQGCSQGAQAVRGWPGPRRVSERASSAQLQDALRPGGLPPDDSIPAPWLEACGLVGFRHAARAPPDAPGQPPPFFA